MLDPSLRGPAPFKVVSCPSSSPIFWGNAVLPPPTPAGGWRGDQGLGHPPPTPQPWSSCLESKGL